MQTKTNEQPPGALLFMAPGCRHCPTVMEGLTRLLKEGKLGRVEMINAGAHPDQASAMGVRSLPWTRIGRYDLTGAQSYADLARWAELARRTDSDSEYLAYLLETGALEQVVARVRQEPGTLSALVPLLATLETPMAARIGVGAVLEEIAAETGLASIVPELIELLGASEQQIRADACHYLGISADQRALAPLEPMRQDTDPEVSEIAAESIAELKSILQL